MKNIEERYCNWLQGLVDEMKDGLNTVVNNYATVQTDAVRYGDQYELSQTERVQEIMNSMIDHVDGCRTAMQDIEELLIERWCIQFEGSVEKIDLLDRIEGQSR